MNSQPVRPLYWSLRRELWENRFVYLAPLITAGLILLGFVIFSRHLPELLHKAGSLDPATRGEALFKPYALGAVLLILISVIVALFYSLDALHGERRDRSILFWKSLPVSDLTTVLSKFCIPMLLLPSLTFVVILAAQLFMLLFSLLVLLSSGADVGTYWTQLPFLGKPLLLLYGLIVLTLWYAPIYAWLLMLSAWAKRTTLLWAILPPLGVCLFEKIAFDTNYFSELLKSRFVGCFDQAFVLDARGNPITDQLSQIAPLKFLGSVGLWAGLVYAAVFLAIAVVLRRKREPL